MIERWVSSSRSATTVSRCRRRFAASIRRSPCWSIWRRCSRASRTAPAATTPTGLQMHPIVEGRLSCWGLCEQGFWWGLVTYEVAYGRQPQVGHALDSGVDAQAQASITAVRAMARKFATADTVDLAELLDFVRPRHRMVLTTFRSDGSLQSSPVTGGVDEEGRIVIASYPQRAKSANLRRDPRASVTVLSDEFNGRVRPGRRRRRGHRAARRRRAARRLLPRDRGRASRLGRVPPGDGRPGKVPDQGHPDAVGSGRDRRLPAGLAARPRPA